MPSPGCLGFPTRLVLIEPPVCVITLIHPITLSLSTANRETVSILFLPLNVHNVPPCSISPSRTGSAALVGLPLVDRVWRTAMLPNSIWMGMAGWRTYSLPSATVTVVVMSAKRTVDVIYLVKEREKSGLSPRWLGVLTINELETNLHRSTRALLIPSKPTQDFPGARLVPLSTSSPSFHSPFAILCIHLGQFLSAPCVEATRSVYYLRA